LAARSGAAWLGFADAFWFGSFVMTLNSCICRWQTRDGIVAGSLPAPDCVAVVVESSLLKERLKILLAVAQALLGFGCEAAQPALQPVPILQLAKLPGHGARDARVGAQIADDLLLAGPKAEFETTSMLAALFTGDEALAVQILVVIGLQAQIGQARELTRCR
jgi:hypothetical protein